MLWSVKHQHGPIFKQQTLARARSALLLLPEQLLPPHAFGRSPTSMLRPGRCRQAGWSVCAGALPLPSALPAAPRSTPLCRLTVGDAGCVAAGAL